MWTGLYTTGVIVNADLEPKTPNHQTPMTCTYGYSHFRHFQNCCNRDGNTIFKYMNYVPIVVATDLEVHFSVLKKGVSQYFCLYSVCTSHWCLVMSFWLKVCIYSHTRGHINTIPSYKQIVRSQSFRASCTPIAESRRLMFRYLQRSRSL